jgi:regulator of protease activity HflC (stomatin/prohibitin superfamily)
MAESKERQAAADAYAIEVNSKANAEAIRREGEAKAAALKAQAEVLKNSHGLIELTKAEALKNWDGSSTPAVVISGASGNGVGGLVPFMNMNEMLTQKSK